MKTIVAEELTKTYPGGVEALSGLTFSVEEGEIFGLLGPNGAGKSTTVKILVTLSTPSGGKAFVGGVDVMKDPIAVRRQLGYVAQGSATDNLTTGRELLTLQGRLFGLGGKELAERCERLLDAFGLTGAAGRLLRTYSGGMRRRLDIACGLIHEPRILFLDEPTTGLDPESRAVLWREVERLASEEGLTILLTTHYLEEVDRLANRLAIIDGGRVVTEGTPDELKRTLRGDRVSVELEDEARGEAAAALLDGLEATTAPPVREGSVIHVQVAEGARAVPAVVSALEAKGLHVVQISLSRPTLDDVYLELTGHSFDHTEKPAPPPSRFGRGGRP